jgi:hypothetical protein
MSPATPKPLAWPVVRLARQRRGLLNVFFLGDRNKKDPSIDSEATRADRKRRVIGAGIMGSGIAAAFVRREIPTAIADAAPEALARGTKLVLEEVSYNKLTKGTDVERTLKFAPLLNATTSDDELAAADVVIEAVVENASVKRQVFARIESKLKDDAILASNTSTIPIARLAEGLKRPEQFCGIHFFNPVRKMPLVEIIRGPKTTDVTVATAVTLAKQIGKSPIVVNDGPGFLVNRLLLPYMNEAVELLLDGAKAEHSEGRQELACRWDRSPCTSSDSTAVNAGLIMQGRFPMNDRLRLAADAHQAGRHGQKSLGFSATSTTRPRASTIRFDRLIAPLLRRTHEALARGCRQPPVPADGARSHARARRAHRPRRSRRRPRPDLRRRLPAVQRRAAVLGRYIGRGQNRRNA